MCSAVIHLVLLIIMGLCLLKATDFGGKVISIEVVQSDELVDEPPLVELTTVIPLPETSLPDETDEDVWQDESVGESELLEGFAEGLAAIAKATERQTAFRKRGSSGHVSLNARGQRRQQALSYGATPESEQAVEFGLEWLARHQLQDGSWSFHLAGGEHGCKNCSCDSRTTHGQALNAATGMTLLAFLGAGNTHLEGEYREHVATGLRFLMRSQKQNGSFVDQGNMYSHGLATLALTEALAMTRHQNQSQTRSPDDELAASATRFNEFVYKTDVQPPDVDFGDSEFEGQLQTAPEPVTIDIDEIADAAQRGIDFISQAQHPRGGWRYQPKQPGDTSVAGWQMMALKSGTLAGLDVDPKTVQKGVSFLDFVADDQIGSAYGYTNGRKRQSLSTRAEVRATTPIGLLCRMYTGWDRTNPGIAVGVERLDRWARANQGLYFHYYATQVMHHYRGPVWDKWNGWMRDYLVNAQSRKGSETGSWQLYGKFDNSGRLYCTALATMTLEVYYRYSPIYGYEAVAVTGDEE
jgi:hypothetical protein